MQRNLEDFGDEFDEEIHPLPPYNTYEFISDYKWFSSVIIALLAIASIYLFIKFKYYRNNSESNFYFIKIRIPFFLSKKISQEK